MSSCSAPWKHDNVMKFLRLFRSYPVIWNPDDPNFRNQFQRELAYDELSYALDTTNEEIKKKIHTMRAQYLVEYKKLKSKKHYRPTWQYFDEFKFVYKQDGINFETLVTLDNYKKLQLNTNDVHDSKDVQKSLLNTNHNSMQFENSTNSTARKRRRLSKTSEEQLNCEDDIPTKIKMKINDTSCQRTPLLSTPNSTVQDEFTIFGENIATELRLLKNHQIVQNTLKSKITRAIIGAKFTLHKARINTK